MPTRENKLNFVSKAWALQFLSDPSVADFWRERGGYSEDLPGHLYYISDGNMLTVIEMFDGNVAGVHVAIPPLYRGRPGIQFGRDSIQFILSKAQADAVLARIQIDRPEVVRYAKACGMLEYKTDDTHKFLRIQSCH